MRNAFCAALVAQAADPRCVFLTGDLGFMALEPLQAALGPRFINAGVAEQNMVSAAAGLASTGLSVWAYSIAPFIYARPFEQVRNDVCQHDREVRLVGNGGGYGYGSMGATHHALEDYGTLLTLPALSAWVPAFSEDVAPIVQALAADPHPAYLRLGRDEKPAGWAAPAWQPWRRLLPGGGPLIVAVGPLAGPLLGALLALPEAARPELWCLGALPISRFEPSAGFLQALKRSGRLLVAEEHVAQGGAGQALAAWLLQRGLAPARFHHAHALGYPGGRYGSQAYHRQASGLDAAGLLQAAAGLAD